MSYRQPTCGNSEQEQPDLFSVPKIAERHETLTPTEKFEMFHRDNPHIYELLVANCRQYAAATGGRRFGARAPWEKLRWDIAVRTIVVDGDPKLNDHLLPFYVRLIEHQCPDLNGLFEKRRAAEADAWADTLGGAA